MSEQEDKPSGTDREKTLLCEASLPDLIDEVTRRIDAGVIVYYREGRAAAVLHGSGFTCLGLANWGLGRTWHRLSVGDGEVQSFEPEEAP